MNILSSVAKRALGAENARLLHRLVIESGWPHRWSYALAGALMLVVSLMFASIALLMRDVFNEVFIAEDPGALRWLAGVVLAIFLVRGAAMYGQNVTWRASATASSPTCNCGSMTTCSTRA